MKHYRATKWSELSEDVLNAAIALGWDAYSWSRWSGEPALYKKKWSQLSGEELSAAHALCHFDVTWPGDGPSINLLNQYDNDNLVNGANNRLVVSPLLLPAVLAIVVLGFFA